MRRVGFLLLLCVLVLAPGACGKKGPPRPPKAPGLPVVKDLRAAIEGGKVRLAWTVPAGSERVAGFIIERSRPEKDICPGCPRDFEEVRKIPAARGAVSFEDADEDLSGKGRFFYRVTPYDAEDRRGAESNEAAVTIE
ncbi:MAG TPA: hypothetical protein VES58_06625 [Syntrophobacteria bacterium]|nr:hypothetical protein [Syntrophobacteria bacterium]